MTKPWVFSYRDYVNLKEDYDKLHSDYWELLTKYAHLKAEKTNLDIKCRILEADRVEVVRCYQCIHGSEDYPQEIREQMDERWKDTEQTYSCEHSTYSHDGDFFCAYGERKK